MLILLCPLHYAAARGMLDNIVALVAKVRCEIASSEDGCEGCLNTAKKRC